MPRAEVLIGYEVYYETVYRLQIYLTLGSELANAPCVCSLCNIQGSSVRDPDKGACFHLYNAFFFTKSLCLGFGEKQHN